MTGISFEDVCQTPQPFYVLKTEVENIHMNTGPRQVMEIGEELGRGWCVGPAAPYRQLTVATRELWPPLLDLLFVQKEEDSCIFM